MANWCKVLSDKTMQAGMACWSANRLRSARNSSNRIGFSSPAGTDIGTLNNGFSSFFFPLLLVSFSSRLMTTSMAFSCPYSTLAPAVVTFKWLFSLQAISKYPMLSIWSRQSCLPVEGGAAELNITANFEYELSVEADWLTVANEGGKYTFTATANADFYYRAVEVVITGWSSEENKFYVFQNGRAEDTWIKYTAADLGWTLAADKTRFAIVGDYILCANGTNVIKVLDAKTGAFLQDKALPEGMNINMLTTDDAGNIVAAYEIPYSGSGNVYYMTSLDGEPQLLGAMTNDVYSNGAGNLRVAGDVTKNASLVMYCALAQYYFAYNVVDGVLDAERTTAALPESDKTVWNWGHCVVHPLGDNLSKGAVYTGYTSSYDIYHTPDMQTWTSVASGVFNGNDNPNSMDIAVVNGKTYLAVGVGTHFSYTQARVEVLDITNPAAVTKVGQWRLPESSSSWVGAAGAWSDVAIVPTTGDSFDLYYFGANNQVVARVAVK